MKVRRWETYRAALDPDVGSEQGKIRPVLIISEDEANDVLRVVNVLPVTTRQPGRRIYGNEATVPAGVDSLLNDSIVLAYQICALDRQRLTARYGRIQDVEVQTETVEALSLQLGL